MRFTWLVGKTPCVQRATIGLEVGLLAGAVVDRLSATAPLGPHANGAAASVTASRSGTKIGRRIERLGMGTYCYFGCGGLLFRRGPILRRPRRRGRRPSRRGSSFDGNLDCIGVARVEISKRNADFPAVQHVIPPNRRGRLSRRLHAGIHDSTCGY